MMNERLCPICSKPIPPYKRRKADARSMERRACSKSCSIKLAHREGRWHLPNPPNSFGPTNTNWKGGVKRTKAGYIYRRAPQDHPYRSARGYVADHRLVMEAHLGRYLEPFEKVHHRNAIKDDNRIENLEIVTHARPNGWVICPHCRKSFQVH